MSAAAAAPPRSITAAALTPRIMREEGRSRCRAGRAEEEESERRVRGIESHKWKGARERLEREGERDLVVFLRIIVHRE